MMEGFNSPDPAFREKRGGFSTRTVGLVFLRRKVNATSNASTYCRLVLIDPEGVDGRWGEGGKGEFQIVER